MKKYHIILAIVFFIISGGCTTIVVGGAATAGIIAVSQDFATTSVDTDFNHAWKVSSTQLKKLGEVDRDHKKLGEIKAIVNESSVKVRISRLTEKTVNITVTARKNLLPNTDLARAVLANIIRNL